MKVCIPVERRFWKYVEITETCWLWTGNRVPKGYGMVSVDSKNRRAHRVSWELHHGPIPAGQFVLHRCDNPPCVNPDHLFLGTGFDNMQDAQRKGRLVQPRPYGIDHHAAKLTPTDVIQIRQLRSRGKSLERIAADFGVTLTTIRKVVNGETWRHIARDYGAEVHSD